jgi:hypothetical protein
LLLLDLRSAAREDDDRLVTAVLAASGNGEPSENEA